MKRVIAFLLCISMVMSLAACGKNSAGKQELPQDVPPQEHIQQIPETSSKHEEPAELDRSDKELIAHLIGGKDAADMSNEELDELVDELIHNLESEIAPQEQVVQKPADKPGESAQPEEKPSNEGQGGTPEAENPGIESDVPEGAYNDQGEMTKPFDQIYPEVVEDGKVSFSGESILIKMKSGTLTEGLKAAGIGQLELIVPLVDMGWYEAKLIEGTDAEEALKAVRQLEEVLLAEYNYTVSIAVLDEYKHFDKEQEDSFKKNGHNKDQWHFHHCGIPDGYEEMVHAGGDSSIVVAVIDSGVDYTHEDLKDNIWVNDGEIPDNGIDDDRNGYVDDYYGVDIVAGSGNGGDTNGHGTHVAGIIAASNNNTGVVGIAYNVKIMSVKAAMHNGTLNQADIARAILYAYSMGAEVINMSFGGSACSIAVQDALSTAYTRCVLVASAGNNAENNEPTPADPIYLPNYPAALTYVLGVMSVDEKGVESSFTNYDVAGFNGVEYELYAPGENIMSTLPDNQYGYLSGTSMSAPVVSAFAAILRSEFGDRDKYPTKFIYGQLASTSNIQADCYNQKVHGTHNLPQVVDLHAALTKLPQPEVTVHDFAIFDSVEIDPEHNNGDGVIDAGETIHLGLILRNRWGMSKNTQVTLDTLSAAGMSDPYITILNPTVDYGSVGTYTTQDAGAIYTDGMLTAWEHPFVIQIAEDIPNDYRMTFNVSIQCENGVDEEDTTLYRTNGKVEGTARRGVILPSIIDQDMVLTKNNLYIVPNATIIQEGVTVRVEPGTHIQFWNDDPQDPYADQYIAYIIVKGFFLVEGTKEEPVFIYPSELMSKFQVNFGSTNTGYISLRYADLTNFAVAIDRTGTSNRVNLAENCTFRFNYDDSDLYYRDIGSNGSIYTSNQDSQISRMNARDCVFYKCNPEYISGTFDRCIFVQCMASGYDGVYKNCVFMTKPEHSGSRYTLDEYPVIDESNTIGDDFKIFYRAETGTTYVVWTGDNADGARLNTAYIRSEFGGDLIKIETMDEMKWLYDNMGNYDSSFEADIHWDPMQGSYVWADGTPLNMDLFRVVQGEKDYKVKAIVEGIQKDWATSSVYAFLDYSNGNSSIHRVVYEIPGELLPEDITFEHHCVKMDTADTYQMKPVSAPYQLPEDRFLYESADETVVTVSETGLVTPVSQGTADVWVWSLDKAVRNVVTFQVVEYVALEGIEITADAEMMAAGETQTLNCTLTPADTTRKHVIYTSSDEAVATVDQNGVVTAVGSGTVTITASGEGITDTVELNVFVKATSLQLSNAVMSVALTDGTLALPDVITSAGAETELSWRSTDETVAVVEDGALTLKAEGTTSLIVTDSKSGLSSASLVIVREDEPLGIVIMENGNSYDSHFVLLEDGSLYQWDNTYRNTPTCIATGVKDFDVSGDRCAILTEDGIIHYGYVFENVTFSEYSDRVKGQDIVKIGYHGNYMQNTFYALSANGSLYAWGCNTYGQLGIGSYQDTEEPTLINLDGVVDFMVSTSSVFILTSAGELYTAGYYSDSSLPVLIDTDVRCLVKKSAYCRYVTNQGKLCYYSGSVGSYGTFDLTGVDQISFCDGSNYIAIRDGKVYVHKHYSENEIPGITNAVDCYVCDETYYVVTADNLLLAFGANRPGTNAMAGVTADNPVEIPVVIPMTPLAEETLTFTDNLQEAILQEESIRLTFNKALSNAVPRLYADGMQVTLNAHITGHNHLDISRTAGFEEGVSYELVFLAGSIQAAPGITNEEEIHISFTYVPASSYSGEVPEETPEETPEEPPEEPVIYEAIVDETVERYLTRERVIERIAAYRKNTQYNCVFTGNVILNRLSTDTEVTHWFRVFTRSTEEYLEIPVGGNYWGTTNETLIGKQILDYADMPTYGHAIYAPHLTVAPENTFPFVTSVSLIDKNGDLVTTVGNEKVIFRVTFNRDMDMDIPLQFRFGSAFPYGDYEVEGQYVNARTWEGEYTFTTVIENGLQYVSIANGCAATEDLELQREDARFGFSIDTTAAQALIMQGSATDTGIELRWTQDDFKTLMGYNVYRSNAENGVYHRLNATVIPMDTMTFFDATVEPGQVYYYNFTVVQSDMTESEPSGKIVIMSKDTMAPDIYHSPVANAFTGKNLVISASVTDNLNIAYANVYYRITGTENWSIIRMNNLNDKYSAIIPAAAITTAGLEYYLEAFDGISYTYKGSADAPFTILVQEAIDDDALGDVDGDGVITNLDALLILYAINGKYNMTPEEFARADLNGDGKLSASEALQILRYVSGVIGSVKMT